MIEENPPSTPPAEVERKLRITRTISNVESADGESLHGGGDGDSAVEEEEQTQQEMDLTIQRKISIISMVLANFFLYFLKLPTNSSPTGKLLGMGGLD